MRSSVPGIKVRENEQFVELDLDQFFKFYDALPDGRTLDAEGSREGSKADRINKCLREVLGEPSENKYWLAGQKTIDDWRSTTRSGTRRKPIMKPHEVIAAMYQIWKEDLSKDRRFSNYFTVYESVSDLLDVKNVAVERLGPDSPMSHKIRFGLVRLNPISKEIPIHGSRMKVRASLGFTNVAIVIDMTGDGETRQQDVKLRFLAPSEPPTQHGIVVGMTVRWLIENREWEMIKEPGHVFNSGQLANASLMEFVAEPDENIGLSIVVEERNFFAIVDCIDGRTYDQSSDQVRAVQGKLIAQVLKKRLDGRRHVLASGNLTAEKHDD